MASLPRMSREQTLAALAYLPVASAILLGLALARSAVVSSFEQLLQAETKIAAELLRGTDDLSNLTRILEDRWSLVSLDLHPTVDEAVVLDGPEPCTMRSSGSPWGSCASHRRRGAASHCLST
jgi:hypothetical protein